MVDRLDFTLDAVSAYTTYSFETHRILKQLMPSQFEVTFDPPQRPGLDQSSKKFSKTVLPVIGGITGTSYSDLISKIAAFSGWVYGDTDKELIFNNQSTKYYNAQVIEPVLPILKSAVKAELEVRFTLNDPFAYDTTPDTDSQTPTAVNDFTYNVTNSGHYYCYPTITIHFDQAQDHIYIQNNTIEDCRFDISQSFASGDDLIINFKTGVVTLNGTETYDGIGVGGSELAEMIRLATGVNQMAIGTDDATIDVDILLSWEKAYLS